MSLTPYFVVCGCAILGGIAQIFLKQGADGWIWTKLIIGVALYGIAFIAFTITLRFGEVSKLYPIIAFSYIVVMFLAQRFIGESVTIINYLGAIFIILGISLAQI